MLLRKSAMNASVLDDLRGIVCNLVVPPLCDSGTLLRSLTVSLCNYLLLQGSPVILCSTFLLSYTSTYSFNS